MPENNRFGYKRKLFYIHCLIILIVIQLIISTICLDIIHQILLKKRTIQIDYYTKLGLVNDPSYTVLSEKYILGIKVQYNELLLIINRLRL